MVCKPMPDADPVTAYVPMIASLPPDLRAGSAAKIASG
ncbi:hypothetical protein XA26_34380 [Mycolicibacterium fortuitum]|uniref:Uncharacterized protein n=1 Tax=Mycolicibacterium fortuitum TaxID=1766 RepID=A0A0N9Y7J6_MYCFO|nr:hypothetical protein XA26_34380 [Mycolicibacterium fortuitum]